MTILRYEGRIKTLKNKVFIGNKKFKIIVCDKLEITNNKKLIKLIGYIIHDKGKPNIFLNRNVKDKNLSLTHEILHGIFKQIENKKEFNKKEIRKLRKNEKFIGYLAGYIIKAFKVRKV